MTRESVIGQVDEVFHCWRVNLLILCCNQKCCYADQLHIRLRHIENGEVAVDKVDRDVERFGEQFKLDMHADQPVDEDSPNVLINVCLLAHVEAIRLRRLLRSLHMLLNVVAVEADVIDVRKGHHVDLVYASIDCIFNALLVSLELVGRTDRRQLVARAKT